MRQRGPNSWQLRVYVGLDPTSGKARYATRTASGGVRAVRRALATFAEEVERERATWKRCGAPRPLARARIAVVVRERPA